MESTQRDALALGVMQKEFKDAEEVTISLGVFNDSEESHGSYFRVADSSDAEESNQSSSGIPYLSHSATSDPEVPPTSDPEIPYTSDAEHNEEQLRKKGVPLTFASTCCLRAVGSTHACSWIHRNWASPEGFDSYNPETGVSSFVGRDNYPPPSTVQEQPWPSANYLPATSLGHFIPPPIVQGIPSSMASQYLVTMAPYFPAGDALPLCEVANGHMTIAPICLPTPSSLSYPRRLSTEVSMQISQIARPNPYPNISSGIRQHGAFINISVIRLILFQTRTDREITGHCATCRTLLPSLQPQVSPPSEGVTQAISETEAGQPSASYHMLLPSLHASTLQQQNEAAARTISEMEAAQLSQVVNEAKHGINAFPLQLEALSFAEDALADAVSKVTGSFEYMVNQTKDKKIISQVACIVDPVHTLFKNIACAQVSIAYNLNPTPLLNTNQIREAVRLHVEYLLQDHNFLYTDELPREFGHCVLTHTLISSMWTMPGAIAKSLDTNDTATINGLVALAGAAL
ncbi:hypothetical protein EDD16DRAFT_1732188, partial [Pisolithus croceorrhizus]